MFNIKKILLLLFFISTSLIGHKVPGMTLTSKLIDENKIEIKGFNKRSQKLLDGNKIKLFSQVNNRVLFEGYLNKGFLETRIPKEPYMIFMYVGEQDVVIEGLAPKSGYEGIYASKTNRAFKYTLGLSLLFVFTTIFLISKNLLKQRKAKL